MMTRKQVGRILSAPRFYSREQIAEAHRARDEYAKGETEIVIKPGDPFYGFVAYSMGHMTEDEARRYYERKPK